MRTDEKIIDRMTRLFLKEVFEKLTLEEQKELNDWIQADPGNKEWREEMKTLKFVEEDYRNYNVFRKLNKLGDVWRKI